MAHRFAVPDSSPTSSSPAPLTPNKNSRGPGRSLFGHEPSTTPAGPPPSSAASFTPAGAPSDAYLSSSIMRNATGGKPPAFPLTSGTNRRAGRSSRSKFDSSNAPLGRSIRGRAMQPSGLSRQFSAIDDEDEEDDDAQQLPEEDEEEEEDAEGEDDYLPTDRGSLFRPSGISFGDDLAEMERYIDQDLQAESEADAEGEEASVEDEAEYEDDYAPPKPKNDNFDMFLNMRHDDRAYDEPVIGEESDLMMLNEPSAAERVRQEAESIFRRSSVPFGGSRMGGQEFEFATIARDLYRQQEAAQLTESPDLITKTETLVCRLYDEGVGPEDDAEKMDNSLANITARLVNLWKQYVDELPQPEGEDLASIGPGENEEPLVKATWVASLILRMHHTRWITDDDDEKSAPLPEVLFDWMENGGHNLQPDQVRLLAQYRPSPACHSLFWQVLRSTLLRGDAIGAAKLLRNAGWENVRKAHRGDKAYTGKALETVRRFATVTAEVLESCPATRGDWDIWDSNWTLFRIKARAELDRLTLFAEGRDQNFDESMDEEESMTTMARKASSQIPWDIYENLQTVYGIVCGNEEAIIDTAQDWCEATIGLFGWWDDGSQGHKPARLTQSLSIRASTRIGSSVDYFERLATAFHKVVRSDLNPNAMNPIEVALASAFEGNVNAVISFLRIWSLPLACTVAEIASLGGWLPPPETPAMAMGNLDADDLALLGVSQPASFETEGIKESTLVLYARELAGIEHLSPTRNGWEMAIQVLGRMDLPEKSEETVGELLRDLLATLDENSGQTVDKIWRILNDLGMINFAEETAETFADILSKESHRYGDALWYYALSHRVDRVREVLNLLISHSLLQSTAYPPEKDLDNEFKDLLRKRRETLEMRAGQDLEAAQLLGRMLSGYATLRKFYELRDDPKLENMSTANALVHRRQAAFALVAVISSADDNIRGGLYDASRDAVVSEDFLLALLGEATVFVQQDPTCITLSQIDILLKAIEDIETVGSRIFTTCEEFFDLTLASGQGLKGSTPADLMRKSTTLGGSSYVMTGSSLLAGQLSKSIGGFGKVQRGWDWRKGEGIMASTKAKDVLSRLRIGLAKDLASLWLEEADGCGV